jgi:Cu(I)/Ag(I) efflux system membrane protein CusA/SilA
LPLKYNSVPVKVSDIGSVCKWVEIRVGFFDANGEEEVVGGIVVMRYRENLIR